MKLRVVREWEHGGGDPDSQKPDELYISSRVVHVPGCECHVIGEACVTSNLRRKVFGQKETEEDCEDGGRCTAWEAEAIDSDAEEWHVDPECTSQRK